MKKIVNIFPPAVWNWVIAFTIGIAVPFGVQGTLASLVGAFNPLPVSPENAELYPQIDPMFSALTLFLGFVVYVIVVCYQILFVVKLKSHSSVLALAFTLIAPLAVWIIVPFVLGIS